MTDKDEGGLRSGSAEPELVTEPSSLTAAEAVAPAAEAAWSESNKFETVRWNTSLAHRILTLAGFSFLLFEVVFLSLYFEHSWFETDLSLYGIPTVFLLCGLAHVLLMLLETAAACRLVSLIWRGKPPVCYRNWIAVNDSGITYGIKHVRWDVIDELELSWFGNLIIRSRVVCGMMEKRPDIVLKVPYGVGDQLHKNALVEMIRARRPGALLNERLQKSLNSPILKGQAMLQLVTSLMMLLVLLDVGYSSFYYLELLKNYYLAGVAGMAASGEIVKVKVSEQGRSEPNSLTEAAVNRTSEENLAIAKQAFARAENMTAHPFPLSWVSSKFLHASNVAAGIRQERSNVLWYLGKKDESIEEARKALKEQPRNLRMELRLVRLLEEAGKHEQAMKEMEQTIEDHENSLLPRIYRLALRSKNAPAEQVQKSYRELLDDTYANTFGMEPWWPPGGDRFYTELYYSRDLRFIMDRLLNKHEAAEAVDDRSP